MKFEITVTVECDSAEDADAIKSEIANAVLDAGDCGELPVNVTVDVDDPVEVPE